MNSCNFSGCWSTPQKEEVRRIIQNPTWNPWTFYKWKDGTITLWRKSWDLRPAHAADFDELITFLCKYHGVEK